MRRQRLSFSAASLAAYALVVVLQVMLQDGTIKPLDQGAKDKALHVICDMAKRSLRCLAAAQKTDLGKQGLAA